MTVQIDGDSARRVLASLAQAGWQSAEGGMRVLDSLPAYSYRAAPMGFRDAAGLYSTRATSLSESGREGIEVERFVRAIAEASVEEVVFFSLAGESWSYVVAASADLEHAIGCVGLPVVSLP